MDALQRDRRDHACRLLHRRPSRVALRTDLSCWSAGWKSCFTISIAIESRTELRIYTFSIGVSSNTCRSSTSTFAGSTAGSSSTNSVPYRRCYRRPMSLPLLFRLYAHKPALSLNLTFSKHEAPVFLLPVLPFFSDQTRAL